MAPSLSCCGRLKRPSIAPTIENLDDFLLALRQKPFSQPARHGPHLPTLRAGTLSRKGRGKGPSPPPLQLRRKRHPARPAARAAQGDEDALLLLVVEVGALQHGAGLALEEFVERQVAGDDAVVGGEGVGVLGRRGGEFSRWFFSFRWFRHYAVRK